MIFQRYEKQKTVKSPRVRVAPSGVITLTDTAWGLIGRPEFIDFAVNYELLVVGMIEGSKETGYRVRQPRSDGGSVSVRGVSVLSAFEVWPLEEVQTPRLESGFLCFSVARNG